MKESTIYNLWVVFAAFAVIAIISVQAGCTSRLTLPAVEYADNADGETWACQDSVGERHVWRVGNE